MTSFQVTVSDLSAETFRFVQDDALETSFSLLGFPLC